MAKFSVRYRIVENGRSTGPSHYDTVVEAAYQSAAEQMVRNMNGPNCQIVYAKKI